MIDGAKSKHRGFVAERIFANMLISRQVSHLRVDNPERDFIVNGVDIDVKSTGISRVYRTRVSGKTRKSYRIGEFNLNKDQRKASLWLAFFVWVDTQCIFIGMYKKPKNKTKAAYSLHEINRLKLFSLDDFLKEIS